MENAPSLYLTVGFFCLRLRHLTQFGIFKVVASILLSSGSALNKARKVACFGGRGCMVSFAICCLVAYSLFKMVMAFHCESGFYSIMTMSCDETVLLQANETSVN